jgi:hypothetical protein
MKAKLNLNGAAIKNFFINNGEKLILIATVLILFSFAYGAITAQPIDPNMPEKIKTESTAVQARVNEVEWPVYAKDKPELTPVDYKAKAEASNQPETRVAKLDHNVPLQPQHFKDLIKRADPKILPVMELVGYGGSALVPYLREAEDPAKAAAQAAPPRQRRPDTKGGKAAGKTNPRGAAGAENPEGRLPVGGLPGRGRGRRGEEEGTPAAQAVADRSISGAQLPGVRATFASGAEAKPKYFTVLTGLIPFEEQYKEYKKKFEDALGKDYVSTAMPPGGDQYTPVYFAFHIQRAEVKDDRDQNLDWKKLDIVAARRETATWAQTNQPQSEPPIDPFYSFSQNNENDWIGFLEWPLPPMYLKNWGFEVTHPKVPFLKMETTEEMMPEEGFVDPDNPNAFPMNPGAPGAQPGVRQPPRGPGFNPRGGMGMGRGRGLDDEGMMGGRGRGMRLPGMRPGGGELGMSTAPEVPYKLYRYVDMNCEPGKRYRYRVQLMVNNPNYQLSVAYLEKPESANAPYVYSAWSEPSPVIEIPMNAQVLASSVASGAEPESVVGMLSLIEWKKPEEKKKVGAATADPLGLPGGGEFGMMNNEPTKGWVEVLEENLRLPLGGVAFFNNVTAKKVVDMAVEIEKKEIKGLALNAQGAMLLDMRNDDPLGGSKSKSPTELLFFDKDGRLFVANGAVDYLTSEDYKDRTYVPPEITGVPGGFDDDFGGRGGFRGGRGEF